MNDDSQPVSPRRRLQELLAIPDRQRTDEQWDELNELEIMLASGNRGGAPEQGARRPGMPPAGQPRPGGEGQGKGAPGRRPGNKFHKRPHKRNPP
jgi:hypothetical protein